MPLAEVRNPEIEEAESLGKEFDFDDSIWESYEERWNRASEELSFYEVIWRGEADKSIKVSVTELSSTGRRRQSVSTN